MLEGQHVLVIGARAGGYGESIARAAVKAGATVYGTTLNPADPREQAFFSEIGAILIDVPLKFDVDRRNQVFESLSRIEQWLRERGVRHLDALIHTVAGGFPRQPSVMKAVSDIFRGKQTFFDMATAVKRNVYYVNGGSFEDLIKGLEGLTDSTTHYLALTYRGDLPYFISHTKAYLERLARRLARQGRRTLIAALPEAWTQSSQFFAGIEVAVLGNYENQLKGSPAVAPEITEAFHGMEESLSGIEELEPLMKDLQLWFTQNWSHITSSSDPTVLAQSVEELFGRLRNEGKFSTVRQAVEIISEYVREACGTLVVRHFLAAGQYAPGDVRQVFYRDLTGLTPIGLAKPREPVTQPKAHDWQWRSYDRDDIRKTLSMYGENFLFVDRVVMEGGPFHNRFIGFGRYTVPTPEQNPILRDHFVDIPLFGGHLQMEAVAQFGTFMLLTLLKDPKLVPILTGTVFPDLNTMAPPGETLTMMGVIKYTDKRQLTFDAFIENRFARTRGTIRGMVLNQRVVRKMLGSFTNSKSST